MVLIKVCPFKHITIEGVPQEVKRGVVSLARTPSKWRGTFRWDAASNETAAQFEARIMEELTKASAKTDSTPQPSRELTMLASTPGYKTPSNASPASQRSSERVSREREKLSPASEAQAQPPAKRRGSISEGEEPSGARRLPSAVPTPPFVTNATVQAAQGSLESEMSTESDSGAATERRLRKLDKKEREITKLQEQAAGRTLSAEEQVKVDSLAMIKLEIGMLTSVTPTASRTPGSAASAAPTLPAAANLAAAVAGAKTRLSDLPPPPTRVGTRSNAVQVRRVTRPREERRPARTREARTHGAPHREGRCVQAACARLPPRQVAKAMRVERAAFERTRQALQEQAEAAEGALLALLRHPQESWGEAAIWQLLMCEWAVEHMHDESATGKNFRAACEEVRHPSTVPRLRGSMQMEELRAAFAHSPLLRAELHGQLDAFKRYYCSLFSGFGRFRVVVAERGESLMALMRRTHRTSLKWRPPGTTPNGQLAVKSKQKGRYIAEWRNESGEMMHLATGKTLSLRGTAGANRLAARRYLKNVPEAERPKQESHHTIRLHQMQAHHIQRSKSLSQSFAVNRCVVQWDEVTLNHLAWSVIILNATHAATDLREREVISCAKLGKDKDGKAKTGKNVGGAVSGAIADYDVPVKNVDFCVSDTTEYAAPHAHTSA
jgi:hypothetical protein